MLSASMTRLALPEITLGNLVEDGAVLVELLDQLRPPSDVNLTKGISNEVCPNDDFDRLFGLNKFDASVLPKRRGLRTYLEWCRDLRLEGLLKFALSVLNTLVRATPIGSYPLYILTLFPCPLPCTPGRTSSDTRHNNREVDIGESLAKSSMRVLPRVAFSQVTAV